MNCHFIIDIEKNDLDCVFGEFYESDGTYMINCANIDSPYALIGTILHEELHVLISETGYQTTEKQDHFIIPRLLL